MKCLLLLTLLCSVVLAGDEPISSTDFIVESSHGGCSWSNGMADSLTDSLNAGPFIKRASRYEVKRKIYNKPDPDSVTVTMPYDLFLEFKEWEQARVQIRVIPPVRDSIDLLLDYFISLYPDDTLPAPDSLFYNGE